MYTLTPTPYRMGGGENETLCIPYPTENRYRGNCGLHKHMGSYEMNKDTVDVVADINNE